MEQHVLMKPCLVPSASGVRLWPNNVSQTHAAVPKPISSLCAGLSIVVASSGQSHTDCDAQKA